MNEIPKLHVFPHVSVHFLPDVPDTKGRATKAQLTESPRKFEARSRRREVPILRGRYEKKE